MYRYKRILVNLALNDGDPSLIAYTAMVARMARSEKVHFAHVATSLEIPADVLSKYPELIRPVDEQVRSQMERLVGEHFEGCGDVEVAHAVAEGPRLTELLRLIKNNDIDLVLTGRQLEDRAARALAEKLARKATCSVLVCPDDAEPKITKILVPIDFSEPSEDAIDVAIAFASASGTATLTCLHIYHVPIGYGKLGVSYEEFGKTMRSHAVRHYDEFIRDQDLKGIKVVPVFRLDDHPAKAIARVAEEEGIDLVVMGARGRGAGAGVLLGSVTERLLHSMDVPLVAVKKKGYGMSVLEALLNL